MKIKCINRIISKILSVLLVITFVLSTIPFTVSAQSAIKTQNEAIEWLNVQEGATYDFNGANGTQCVEFVKAYVNWLLSGSAWTDCWNRATLDGCNIWKNSLWAELGWEVYSNTAGFMPQPGDIFSAGLGTNGNHTGVVISADSSGAYIAEANARNSDWSDGDPVRLKYKTWQSADSDSSYGPTHFIRPTFKAAHTCTFGSWSIVNPATCTTTGTQQRSCTGCGAIETQSTPALGHSYSTEFTVDKNATCIADGSKSRHCYNCGDKTDVTVIQATGHNYNSVVTAPTQDSQGYTTHTCTLCGDVYVDSYTDYTNPIIESGNCGTAADWELYNDGTLKIIGSGVTKNYGTQQSVPWYSYASQIKRIEIDETITKIGHYNFYCISNLESVTTNNADLTFGSYVFKGKTTFYSFGAGTLEEFVKSNGHTLVKPENPETVLNPELVQATMTSITLKHLSGYEYSIDGVVWQDSNVFTNLFSDTEYVLCQRIKEGVYRVSATSEEVRFSTLGQIEKPIIEKVDGNTVTIVAENGYEYSVDGDVWQTSNVFTALDFDKILTFYQRITADGEYMSEATECIIPSAPEIKLIGATKIVLKAFEGYEYSLDGEYWQDSNVFTMLVPEFDYVVYQRYVGSDIYTVISDETAFVTNGWDLNTNPSSVDLVELKKALFLKDENNNLCFDYNLDNEINILDLIRLKKYLLGVDVPFEVTVTFMDFDGDVIDIQKVVVGNDAVLPTEPTRKGYTFTGWDKDTTNISVDTVFTAQYELKTYTVNWNIGTGYNITVSRTNSPYANSVVGSLNSGDTVYFGDELTVEYVADTGYSIIEKGFENITVTKDITDSDIYVIAELKQYTYNIVYKSTNGTHLGSDTVTRTHGTTETVSAKAFSGYITPSAQQVVWDTDTKTVTFIYTPEYVAQNQWIQGGDWYKPYNNNHLRYNVTLEYTNRTATSVQVRIHWTNTITQLYYGYHQYFDGSIGGVGIGTQTICDNSKWPKPTKHSGDATKTTDWYTIPINTTNQIALNVGGSWWSTGGDSGTWNGAILIPAY